MSTTLQDLLAQREALERQINELRAAEMSEAVSKIHALMKEYGLTQKDLFTHTGNKAAKTSSSKVAAKYRDPVSGKEWSGRGLAPKWLAGKNREEFLIA